MKKVINFKENSFVVRNEIIEMLRVEVNRYKTIENDEVVKLIMDAHNGNERARTKVINANLRLVWSVAASYGTMMEFSDMFQNGSIGLCMAIDTYDVSRETKFSTWATEYIRKQIFDSSNNILSVNAVHTELIKLILFASVLIIILIVLALRRLYKFFFVYI